MKLLGSLTVALVFVVTRVPHPAAMQAGAAATRVGTAAELTAALKTGGRIELAAGTYAGNFVVTAATTLNGPVDAVLAPENPPSPTLTVQANDVQVTGLTIRNGAPDRETVVVGS